MLFDHQVGCADDGKGESTSLASQLTRDFDTTIAPLLQRSCIDCHNGDKREGGLALDTREHLLAGGDSGSVLRLDDWRQSPLWRAISPGPDGEPAEMPKGKPALPAEARELIGRWLSVGAPFPKGKKIEHHDAVAESWWAFQPLPERFAPIELPLDLDRAWSSNRIDDYILAAQFQRGLQPTTAAARGPLLRRLTYDLTGLPPTPEAISEFEQDRRPDAYLRRVDRLLASPALGERWARHWLDVVHYGETHGYDKDKMRPNAWPYRDYVIRAFNSDKPYSDFVTEQIAGDALRPHESDAIEALGFLAAGPWDYIGHAEVPETKRDGKLARHLDRDDMVQNTFLTFQSMTVGCAQCHHHKFDPISQTEYYGLQAVFAALDRAERKYYRQPQQQIRFAEIQSQEKILQAELESIRVAIESQAGEGLRRLDKKIAALKKQPAKYPVEHGYHSALASEAKQQKWVQIDLGEPVELAKLEWIACHDDFAGIGDGFGFPKSYRIEAFLADELPAARQVVANGKQPPGRKIGIERQSVDVSGVTARYIRFVATELALRQNDYIFALAELRVLDTEGRNVALGKTVTALDSIEAPVRWTRSNLVDDKYPLATESDTLEQLTREREAYVQASVAAEVLDRQRQVDAELAKLKREMDALPAAQTAYVATIHYGKGSFAGTGPVGGRPRPVEILPRGDVSRSGPLAQPIALSCVRSLEPRLTDLSAGDAQRRLALAQWLASPKNELTWRSIANRIWAYHFGRGIVDTPNDFGRMGSLPTHPELLDLLASEVLEHQSLKRMHRSLLLSSTYQQGASCSADVQQQDPDNRWLTRANRKRLEAEAIRDSMLAVSGLLRREMGGPSYQDFVIEHPEHSPHYEYRLHDPRDAATMRRSIYRMIVRSQTQPLMTSLDCADPSMQVDKRSESASATQALSMLNNAFTIMAAEEWALQMERHVQREENGQLKIGEASDMVLRDAIARMLRDCLARAAEAEELDALVQLARQHDLTAVARVLFNLNEFVYVD